MNRKRQNIAKTHSNLPLSVWAMVAFIFVMLFSTPAFATVYYVGSAADTSSGGACTTTGNSDCSLREAVSLASAVAGDDTINIEVVGTITLTSGQMQGNNGIITIIGQGAASTIIDGNNSDRIFEALWTSAGFNFQDITLQNGNIANLGGCVKLTNNSSTVTNSTFSNCQGTRGGAIFSDQNITVTVSGSTFTNNKANNGTATGGGGAIEAKGLTITNSTFTGNQVTGTSAGRGGALYSPTSISITNSTFTNNQITISGNGGAIYSLGTMTITGSTFNTNSTASGEGGAAYIGNGGTAPSITDSYFVNNSSSGDGGAVRCIEPETLTIDGTTFETNSGARGAALAQFDGNATITNSTFSGNTAATEGGAIRSGGANTITSKYSTFYGNSAGNANSGGAVLGTNFTTLGSIFSGNTSNSVANACGWSVVTTSGYNVDHSGECGFIITTGDVTGDPLLSALADNGGPTKTHAVSSGPAVDGGPATCTADTGDVDQRNTARPQGTSCDIGAYEYLAPTPNTVCASGCEFTTIQSAIDGSVNGETITVYDGTYAENINFNTKVITLVSQNGAASTSIVGTGADAPVVTFANSALTSSTVLDGFTINNANDGGTTSYGIKITTSAAPTLQNLILKGNQTALTSNGGAIYISGGSATILNSTIGSSTDINLADRGAGIYAYVISSALTITNVTFDSNETDYRGGALYIDNVDNYAVTISNSTFNANKSNEGAAIYVSGSAQTTTISSTNFTNNLAANDRTTYSSSTTGKGGAIFVYGSTVSVSGGTFTGNKAFTYGGVYDIEGSGDIIINGGTYSNNEATSNNGGALYASNGNSVNISNATFSSNSAPAGYGGAFYIAQNPGGTTISNTTISNNSSNNSGGGLYFYQLTGSTTVTITNNTQITGNQVTGTGSFAYGGGMYLSGNTTFSMTGGSVSSNSAEHGGGMAINSTNITVALDGVTVNSNTANTLGGGGIGLLNGTLSIDDSFVQGNTCLRDGAGINIGSGTTATITNTVITGNRLKDTTSVYYGGGVNNDGTLNLYSSVIAGNYAHSDAGGLYANGTENIYNSIIYGNTAGTGSNHEVALSYGTATTSIIGSDPLFANLQQANNTTPTTAGDYRLCYAAGNPTGCASGPSSGIDTGGPTNAPLFDIVGEGRPVNVSGLGDGIDDYDIGAYEFPITANSTDARTATATVVNSTSILVSMPWLEDDNGNNTYTVDYKLSSEPTIWTNWVTAATHTTSPYQTTITGLTTDSSYDIRITFNDTDGITGTNPQTITGVTPYIPHYYVGNTGTTAVTTNCTTPGNATCTLPGALSLLSTNEEVIHVELAGTYSVAISIANKTFTLQSDVGTSAILAGNTPTAPVIDISGSSSNANLVIDGFTIDHYTTGTSAQGIRISSSAAPTLKNLLIKGNNGSTGNGGGIYIDGATATIQDSIIGDQTTSNQAYYGAGLYATTLSNTLTISNTTFKYNASTYYGGAIYIGGGSYGMSITNSTFNNNTGTVGGAFYLKNAGSFSITSTSIYSNEATTSSGGGLYALPTGSMTLTIDKSYIQGNQSKSSGGGLYFSSSVTSTITNTLISGNRQHTNSFVYGGGIYNAGTLNLYSSTIAGNHADYKGGGLHAGGTETIRNSIIYGNTANNSAPNVNDTIETETNSNTAGVSDPLFVNTQSASTIATTAGDYRLCYSATSPDAACASGPSPGIDSGAATNAPTSDLVGTARPQDVSGLGDGVDDYDMGVYEYVPAAGVTISGTVYSSDETTAITTGVSVRLLVNGGSAQTTTSDGSGNYSFTASPSAGDVLTVHIDNDATYVATTVTNSDSNALSGLDLYDKHLIVRDDNAGSITNANLATGDDTDADILYNIATSNLTVEGTGTELYVWSGDTFAPGGTIATHDIDIRGNLASSSAIDVSGSWFNGAAATLTLTGTTTFSSVATGETITADGESLGTVVFDSGDGNGEWTLQDAFTASAVTVTDGHLIDNAQTVTIAGDILIANTASIMTSTGTWIQSADGNISNPYWSLGGNLFSTIQIADGVTSTRTAEVMAGKVVMGANAIMTGAFSINIYKPAANDFIDLGINSDITLRINVQLENSTTRTQKAISLPNTELRIQFASTATVQMTGDWNLDILRVHGGTTATTEAAATIVDTNGYNLTLNSTGDALRIGATNASYLDAYKGKVLFSTGTHTIAGSIFPVADGTDIAGYLDLGSSNLSIGGNVNLTEVTVTPGTSTVTLNGTADQTVTNSGNSFNNLTLNNIGASNSDNIIMADALDVNGTLTITDGDLDISTNNPAVNAAGNVSIGANGSIDVSTRTANWTYDGTSLLTDASAGQDFQAVVVNGTSLTLGSNTKVQSMTITAGTLNLGSAGYVLEIDGTGTPLSNSGTFTAGTSTVKYTGTTTATNIATLAYNNLQLAPTASTTYSLTGNLTAGNALTGNLTVDTNAVLDSTVTNYGIAAVDITINGSYTAQGSSITFSGNWDNNGTFTPGTSSVVLNGTSQQLYGSASFYNLTKSVTTAATLTFEAGQTTTLLNGGTVTLNGAAGQLLTLASSTGSSAWNFTLNNGANKVISYVSVSWSNASGSDASLKPIAPSNSTDGGNNTDWFGFVISGTVYTDEGTTTIPGSVTVRLIINGSSAGTATTSTGAYSITAAPNAGDAMIVYIDGDATYDGTTVTVSDGAALSGLNIYADRLIVRQDNAGSLTNANMTTALGAYSDTEILYTTDVSDNLTVTGANTELFVWSGHTYAAEANITASKDVDIRGTLDMATLKNITLPANGNLNIASGATLSGLGEFWRNVNDSSSHIVNSGTISIAAFEYYVENGSTVAPITATTYGTDLSIFTTNSNESGTAVMGSGTITITGTLLIRQANGSTSGQLVVDNSVNNAAINANHFNLGASGQTSYNKFLSGSATVILAGDTVVYPSDANGTNELDLGSSNWTVRDDWLSEDLVTPGTSTVTLRGTSQTLMGVASGTTLYFYDLILSDGSAGDSLELQTTLDVANNLTLAASTFKPGNYNITTAGNVDISGGTVDLTGRTSGTWTLDGTAAQSVTSGGQSFVNLVVTNASAAVSFVDALSTTNFTATTASTSLKFQQSVTHTISGTININGQASGTKIAINSVDGVTRFNLSVGTVSQTVHYVDVSNSEILGNDLTAQNSADTSNNDSGEGSPQWIFTVNISGTVYTDEGTTTIPDSVTVRLVINGSSVGTATTSTGTYAITAAPNAGDAMIVYIDGDATYDGATVTVSDGTALSGLNIYADRLIVRQDNAGSLTNANMTTALGAYSDTEILYTTDVSNNLTVGGTTTELFVWSGHTYVPGATIDAISVDVRGTLTAATNAINVSGNWFVDAAATFTSTGTVTFDAITNTNTIETGGDSFNEIVFNDAAGTATWELQDALNVASNFTLTDGIVDTKTGVGGDNAINITGNLAINGGNLTANGSTITVAGNVAIASTAGLFTKGTSTVDLTGTGTVSNANENNAFNLLKVGAASKTTTISATTYTDKMHLGTGGLTRSSSAEPHIGKGTSNQTIITSDGGDTTGTFFRINLYGTNNHVAAVTLTDAQFVLQANASIDLTGNITINSLRMEEDNISFSVGTYNATINNGFLVGSSTTATTAVLNLGSGTVTFSDSAGINGNINGGSTTINLESATINIGAVFWTMMSGVTVNPGTSTVIFKRTNGDQTITSAGNSFNNVTINNTNADTANDDVVLADALDVNGNLTLTDGQLHIANYNVTVGGNATLGSALIDTTGRTTATWILDGTGTQSITSGGHIFTDLIVTNASDVVTFTDALSTGDFTATTASTQLTFTGGTTNTISGTLNLNGQASGTRILLRSTNTTQYTFDVTGGAQAVSYVDVQYAAASSNDITASNSIDGVGNDDGTGSPQWVFNYLLYGTVYTDEGTTNIGANKTIHLVVNGASQGTVETNPLGEYGFMVTPATSDLVLVYIDGETENGNTVSIASGATLSGLDIYQDRLIVRHETAGPISNANLGTAYYATGDADIFYSVATNDLTLDTATELFVWAGDTHTPGGTIDAHDVDVRGTLNAAANAINVDGNWNVDAAATFTSTGTVTFDATSATNTITMGGTDANHDFYDVIFNDAAGSATFQLQDAMAVTNDFTVTDGIVDTTVSNYAITVGGNFSQAAAGQVEANGSTITVTGNFSADGTTDSTDYNSATLVTAGAASAIAFNNLSQPWNNGVNNLSVGTGGVTDTVSTSLAIQNDLTIGTGGLSGTVTLYMRGNTDVLFFDAASNLSLTNLIFMANTANLPTLINGYDTNIIAGGIGPQTITQTGAITLNTGKHLKINGDGDATRQNTLDTGGNTLTVGGDLIIGAGSDTGAKGLTANASTINVAGNFTINSGSNTFASGTSTVIFNGTTDQTVTTAAQTFNNVTLNNTGTNGTADNIIISGALDINGVLTITDGDLDISTNDPVINTAGNVSVGANGSVDVSARTSNWIFDGTSTLTDSSAGQDFEDVVVSGTSLTLGSNAKVQTMNVSAGTLNLGSAGYVLEIDGTGTPLSNSATFTPGTSTVKYSGSGSATNIAAVDYNNLQLTPTSATTYSLLGNLTVGNALTGNLTIDSGATLDATVSNYGVTAVDITNNGSYTAQGSTITFSGNWDNNGTFTPGTSSVVLNGTNQQLYGSATFNNLTKSVTSAATLTFEAGQTTTVSGAATLNGASGQLLTLASSSPGTHWNITITASGSKTISYVSVSWSNASGSDASHKPINPSNSTDGGNNVDWFGGTPDIAILKATTMVSDPINNTTNPKRIPGAVMLYTLITTNSGTGSPDANSTIVTDVIDASNVSINVTDGITFTDGTTSSGLTLGTVSYSSTAAPGPYIYTYTPTPDGDGYDANVTSIKITTSGTFNYGGSPAPSFTLQYKVRVK